MTRGMHSYILAGWCMIAPCHKNSGDLIRSDDSDDNENVIRAIGLKSKTTTLHVYHTFLFSSLPFFHDYDVKKALFHVL